MNERKSGGFSLDRSICDDLRAAAIVAVIAGHILGGKFGLWDSYLTAILGTGAVNVFLILSGYGLFCSYKSSGLGGINYWQKKIQKVLLPYAVVTLLYYFGFMRPNGAVLNPERLLMNVIGLDFTRAIDGTMWYISFLLIWYGIFFAVFYFDYPILLKLFLIWQCGGIFSSNVYGSVFLDCGW